MNELQQLLANGHYVYYKSLQHEGPFFSDIYLAGSQRVKSTSSILNNDPSEVTNSQQYNNFQDFMSTYITKLKQMASTLRNNEITYINGMISKSTDLLSQENLSRLNALKTKTGLREDDYQELLVALNKVQYKDRIQKLEDIMQEQIGNIEKLQTNLQALKDVDPDKYNKLKSDYLNNYGKYVNEYIGVVKSAIKEKFLYKKTTKIQTMATTINAVLNNLMNEPTIEPIIKEIWAKHPNEKSVTITSKDGNAFTAIIDVVVDQVINAKKGQGAAKITQSIIEDIKNRTLILPSVSQQQAFKVMTAKEGKVSLESILNSSNQTIIDTLRNATNAREMLESFFPDNPKKVETILFNLTELEKKLKDVPTRKINSAVKNYKINDDDTLTFEESLRKELEDTMHYKTISAALGKKIKSVSKKNQREYNIVLQERLRTEMQKNFSVKIDKSGLAELVSEHLPELKKIFSGVPGNEINLKDDVWCAFHLKNIPDIVEKSLEDDEELNDLLTQVDNIINENFSTYIKDYSKASDSKKRGQTDVARANELYIEKLEPIIALYQRIKEEDADLFKKLQEYMQNNGQFIESISVKEYDLYDDEIGFHAGTLGPTTAHILNNIENMYLSGGITPLDAEMLSFALINCSDAAAGGAALRKSLEMYLLGGAALMVFDEGFGSAQKYLENMEPDIQAILPKNLNLYFLNELYVPASYILESIAQNLESFYKHEINDNMNKIPQRGHVIISNVPQQYYTGDSDVTLMNQFQEIAEQVYDATSIQFIFMGGMLDIFKNLSKVFKQ